MLVLTRLNQLQESELTTLRRPGQEQDRIPRNAFCIVTTIDLILQICERPILRGIVEPVRDSFHEQSPRTRRARSCCPHLLVALGIGVAVL
jgi:hypothetical protein